MLMEAPARAAWKESAPAFLAGSAATAAVVSIAASQILLGLAIVALVFERSKLRWPPVTFSLLLWMAWTVVSLAATFATVRRTCAILSPEPTSSANLLSVSARW